MNKVCNTCKHLKRSKSFTCPAFPDGIPMMFLSGSMEHAEPVPNQKGKTVWEGKKEA